MNHCLSLKGLGLSVLLLAASAVSEAKTSDDLVYYDLSGYPLLGTLAPDASIKYSRLPDSIMETTRDGLKNLGKNSAGMNIRFRSNTENIAVRFKPRKMIDMNHMTLTGISGLDLYTMLPDSSWTTVSSARPSKYKDHTQTMLMTNMTPEMREYMLYLPLYDGVDSIYVGVDSTATVLPPAVDLPIRNKPIVMYGTSILQGGCASRPGMAHTSILSRMLNREVINLGFSGNAQLDPEIARLIAQSDASIIVIDALPNVKTPELIEKMPLFYKIVRDAHPTTPIVFVESPIFPVMRFDTKTNSDIREKNAAFKKIYDGYVSAGDKNLYYFTGENVLGDLMEATVDNYHLTDLGFTHFANALYPLLKSILK
jgi:hypothetical protein